MSKSVDLSTASFELNKPWSFGSHALLSDNDRVYITRLLECQNCRIRHVYHGVIARELSKRPTSDFLEPIQFRHHFHQLTRLIKAVLIACNLQKKLYRTGGSVSTSIPPILGLPLSRTPRLRRWICQCHATDLFYYLLYAAEDDIYDLHLKQVNSSKPAKWINYIFPKGSSTLYEKSLSDFEKATSVSHFRNSIACSSFIPCDRFFQPSSGFELLMGTACVRKAVEHSYLTKEELADANRRFNEGYKNLDSVKHVEREGKCVRFPKFSPVTRIYNLITYETACRHLRRDRCWELCCLARVREGQNNTDDDDADDDSCDKYEEKCKNIGDSSSSPSDLESASRKACEINEVRKVSVSICNVGYDRVDIKLCETQSVQECVVRMVREEEKELEVPESAPDMYESSFQKDSSEIVDPRNKGRRPRRRHDNIIKVKPSPSPVPFPPHSVTASTPSFQRETTATYLQQISSLLFNDLYSTSPTESSSPSVKLVDELCISEVSQKS